MEFLSDLTCSILFCPNSPIEKTEIIKVNENHSTQDQVERTLDGKLIAVNFPLNRYEILTQLGKGQFGSVYLVTNKDKNKFAMKVVRNTVNNLRKPSKLQLVETNDILKEIEIMKSLDHPHLVRLIDVFIETKSPLTIFMVLEYLSGPMLIVDQTAPSNMFLGPLFVCSLTNGIVGEATASRLFRGVINGMKHLHQNHIAHRDLKPDNILLDFQGNVRIADFGVSNKLPEDRSKVMDTAGTWSFWAPEIFDENNEIGYSAYPADVWAAGVCLWTMIFGRLPFWEQEYFSLSRMIRGKTLKVPRPCSPELQALLFAMLNKSPNLRPKFSECESYSWIQEHHLHSFQPETEGTSSPFNITLSPIFDSLPSFSNFSQFPLLWSPTNEGKVQTPNNTPTPTPTPTPTLSSQNSKSSTSSSSSSSSSSSFSFSFSFTSLFTQSQPDPLSKISPRLVVKLKAWASRARIKASEKKLHRGRVSESKINASISKYQRSLERADSFL